MSRDAINDVTLAIQQVLQSALAGGGGANGVFVGPPIRRPNFVTNEQVSLFLFHVEPNKELRNTDRRIPGRSADLRQQNTIPLDLRYLVSVHRQPADSQSPNELSVLGQVVAGLQAVSVIADGLVPDQEVRLTPEPYPMEEMSRIWGLFGQQAYATSMVYLATPVFVDAGDFLRGAPVQSRRLHSGSSAELPDMFGPRGGMQQGVAE